MKLKTIITIAKPAAGVFGQFVKTAYFSSYCIITLQAVLVSFEKENEKTNFKTETFVRTVLHFSLKSS